MTLGLALSNAVSGLNVVQSALATTSNNITNANTEGYNRKIAQNSAVVTAGIGTGASTQLKRVVDDFLVKSIRDQQSATGLVTVRLEYMDRLQAIFGQPDSGSTIMDSLDDFYAKMSNLSASPEQPYFRAQAVDSATTVARRISGITTDLQKMRLEADREIADVTSNLNNALDRLYAVNNALRSSANTSQGQDNLLDQRDAELNTILSYVDLGVTFKDTGEVVLYNRQADVLNGNNRYHFSYVPAGSISSFTDDSGLADLNLIGIRDGEPTGEVIALSTGATSSDYETELVSGRLKGLLEVRDVEIPKMLEQLDSLATGLRDTINAIHNDGAGFPPPQSLTGTTLITNGTAVDFDGSVMIAVTNADGTPPASPYSNDYDRRLRPLTLNFDKIYGAAGWGDPTMGEIAKEINQYYDSPAPRAAFGPLADVRLVAMSDNTTGPFEFDLEMENAGPEGFDVTIVSVEGAAMGDTLTLAGGQMDRTGPTNTYSVAGAGPYSIQVEIQFTDPVTGDVYNDTITYDIPAAASGLRGNRIDATSLAGGTGTPPDGQIIIPDSNARFATAQLVNANGVAISPTDTSTQGYLQIIGNGSGYGIGIAELTSANTVSGRGFSHHFGLNNLFVENTSTVLGSDARNLAVRDDIKSNPNRLSTGSLQRTLQPSGTTVNTVYSYELTIGGNQTVSRLANLQESSIAFGAAGTLPAYSNTATAYASEIYSFVGGIYNNASNDATQQGLLNTTYEERMTGVSGVNIDEELANTVLYQNAYSASARIITVVSTLFDVLLQIRS